MTRLTTRAAFGLLAAAVALPAAAVDAPTYSRDVAPILDQNCASCHRAGEIIRSRCVGESLRASSGNCFSSAKRLTFMPSGTVIFPRPSLPLM